MTPEIKKDSSFSIDIPVIDLPWRKKKQIIIHGLYKKSIQKTSCGTILLLPGLDDSVFEYKKTIRLIMERNPEWNLLAVDLRGQGRTFESEKI